MLGRGAAAAAGGEGQARPARPAGPDWQFDRTGADPLADCLLAALHRLGIDLGPSTLTAGLPLPRDGRLTPPLAVEALERHQIRARLVRRPLSGLPDAVLPAVLFLKGRDACLLLGRESDGRLRILRPQVNDSEERIDAAALAEQYHGAALLLRPEPTAATDAPGQRRAAPRHWFWSAVGRYWPAYLQVALAAALVNVLALATPIFTMNVYDRVFPNAALITLWSLVAGVGLVFLFDAILKAIRASVVDAVGRKVDLRVSSDIFAHIADLRLEANTMPSGSLMNTLKDFEQVRDFFSSQTVATLTDLAFAILFIGVIAYLGGPLAWPPTIALGVVLVVGLVTLFPLRRAANDSRLTTGVKNAVAVEAISDLETLKAVAGQGRMQARWEQHVADAAAAQERTRRWANLSTTISGTAQQAASVGIVVIGVYLALEGRITMGAVIAAMILSGRALAPTAALSGLFVRGSFALSTLRSLNQVMNLPSDSRGQEGGLNAALSTGAIAVEDVGLDYPAAQVPALKEVSLEVAPGDRVGLIGAVGAGKTSLVRLMAGLYHPTDGAVLLDGINMRQLPAAALRDAVQLVPQEPVLFSGTLAENIAFGRAGARDEDILRAARAAGVDRIAAQHPQGFAMPITERGRNLSGGQRQMVALARALLVEPRVLILDEPTSSMDSQNEKLFIARLKQVIERRPMTLVISTHRMGLLDLVDRLVLLDRGQVRANGSKADVLAALERRAKGGDR
ncbi:type I secretion system permease/ATPase [Oceanomicrobium pacificus]|uniref:type I secretion system permease/ATPase n=1 Tax=Oceanomicrobium pacificus TaxID=2692916 RepID=UPI002E2AA3D9|nr:type I secretion system permease/ATPase [Oceanomicrobium pacificus]